MIRAFVFVAILFGLPAAAQICGGIAAPCMPLGGGEYHVAAPDAPNGKALVFLHEFSGRGEGAIKNKGLLKPFLPRGYTVVAQQGRPFRAGSKGGAWDSFNNPVRRDDVAFLMAVVDNAARLFALNRDEILLGGFSGGGMMT